MNAILNLTLDLQTQEQLSLQGETDLQVVISATSFLLSLINDLLDFSRILHGKFELQKQNFALEPLLRQCAQLFDQQGRGKMLDLRLRIDPLLPVLLYSDETRLRQILLNLLSNALKFTLHGSILLVVLMANSSQLQLKMEATGIGIAKQTSRKCSVSLASWNAAAH